VVSGVATLANVGWALSPPEMLETCHLRKIPTEIVRSGEVARWTRILTDVRWLATPVFYNYPSGDISWVDLTDDVSREIAVQPDEPVVPPSPHSR
jgi:hypothetical protein